MTTPATGPRRTNPTPWGANPRLYVFAVTALAVFFLGIMFWRTPIKGYAVAAKISLSSSDEVQAVALRDEILEVENLRQALRHVGPDPASGAEAGDDFPSDNQVQRLWGDLKEKIVVQQERGKQKKAALLLVHIGVDRRWSLALLDRLTRQATVNHLPRDTASDEKLDDRDLVSAVVEARREEMQSQQMLDALLQKTIQALGNRTAPSQPQIEDKSAYPDDELNFQPRKENADWLALQRDLDAMRQRREQLLSQRTPEHPNVLALEEMIDKLRKRLDDTTRYVGDATDDSQPEISLDKKSDPKQTSQTDPKILAAAAEYEKLQDKYQEAQMRRIEAEAVLEDARSSSSAQQEKQAKTPIEIAEPARVIQRIGGTPTMARVISLGLLASIAGGLLAWYAGGKKADVLAGLDEVRQQLSLPIVAALSTPRGPVLPKQQPNRQRFVRYATLGCEAVLTVVVFGFLFLALLDSSLIAEFASDPFATFGEAASRVTMRPF